MVWTGHAGLNVIVGENDTGKTQLLKLLYAVVRAAEEFWRKQGGPQPTKFADVLRNKLLWTFMPGGNEFALGKLVHRGRTETQWRIEWKGGHLETTWGSRAQKHLADIEVSGIERLKDCTATFVPAKEILSLFEAIRETRERTELASFDDTYFDLFRDFQQSIPRGRLQDPVYEALERLTRAVGGGEVEMDQEGAVWWVRGRDRFPMSQTAEGIRKVGVLFRLLRNRRINPQRGGFLFVDEPEANLHPRAEVLMATLLYGLARSGIQVYVATHSYFVIKRLEQLAREHQSEHRLLDLRLRDGAVEGRATDLRDGLPDDSPILAQAVELFERDMHLDFAGEGA
jgi:energy-coupling factor transporter ATP-binding protein EcfA2